MKSLLKSFWVQCSLLLFLALFLYLPAVSKPFTGYFENEAVRYLTYARNYDSYGAVQLKFSLVTNTGRAKPNEFEYNRQDLPLFPLLLSYISIPSISYDVAGRFSALGISLLTLVGIVYLSRMIVGERTGIIAGLVAVITPLLLYHATLPVPELLTVFFLICFAICYNKWTEKYRLSWLFGMAGTTALMAVTTWQIYFIIPVVIFHAFIFHHQYWKRLLWLVPVLLVVYAGYVRHLSFITGELAINDILTAFLNANNGQALQYQVKFTYINFVVEQFRWLRAYFTGPLLLFSGLWFIAAFQQWWVTDKLDSVNEKVVLLLLMGAVYAWVFPNVVYVHPYISLYLLPFFIISSIAVLEKTILFFRLTAFHTLILYASVCVTVGYYGLTFFQTIEAQPIYKTGKDLGDAIRTTVSSDEAVLIQAPAVWNDYAETVGYYANRKVVFADYNKTVWEKQHKPIEQSYTYVIVPEIKYAGNSPVEFFETRYLSKKIGQFTFYQLQ